MTVRLTVGLTVGLTVDLTVGLTVDLTVSLARGGLGGRVVERDQARVAEHAMLVRAFKVLVTLPR